MWSVRKRDKAQDDCKGDWSHQLPSTEFGKATDE